MTVVVVRTSCRKRCTGWATPASPSSLSTSSTTSGCGRAGSRRQATVPHSWYAIQTGIRAEELTGSVTLKPLKGKKEIDNQECYVKWLIREQAHLSRPDRWTLRLIDVLCAMKRFSLMVFHTDVIMSILWIRPQLDQSTEPTPINCT